MEAEVNKQALHAFQKWLELEPRTDADEFVLNLGLDDVPLLLHEQCVDTLELLKEFVEEQAKTGETGLMSPKHVGKILLEFSKQS